MIKIIEGDILTCKADIIAHQVNCRGKFNSGVAKAIKDYDENIYNDYLSFCEEKEPLELLGKVRIYYAKDNKFYANLFAQNNFGYDGQQYTEITALKNCFYILRAYMNTWKMITKKEMILAMPFNIGCVRGGASWDEVSKIIDEIFEKHNVELWKLDKG